MWDEVGILRDAAGLSRAEAALVRTVGRRCLECGIGDQPRGFNLTWHDWLNLESQILVSRTIAAAARKRENSRGAHFREDFPDEGALETSRYTVARLRQDAIEIGDEAVDFAIVRPGQSLIEGEAGAPPPDVGRSGPEQPRHKEKAHDPPFGHRGQPPSS